MASEYVDDILDLFECFKRILGRPLTANERTLYFAGRIDGMHEEAKRHEANAWKTAKAGSA